LAFGRASGTVARRRVDRDPAARETEPVVQQARGRASGAATGVEVTDLDKRIIEHLQQDGRRAFTRIAADLGVSEAAVGPAPTA
jgi:hypothetical protein